MAKDILTVEGLKAYYQMNYFGVRREVRAVDDITMTVRRNEVYGIAGESSSGKTSFIKVLAAAIRPPLRIISGTAKYQFKGRDVDVAHASPAEIEAVRWRHQSYIMQGSMSVLNPEQRTIGISGLMACIRRLRSVPFISGMVMSVRTRSKS